MSNEREDKQSGSNKDNWMGLPHPGSPVLSHRLLNALRLDDIWHSKEALRGMIRQAAIEVAELERQASASSSCAARDAALEEAARICDRYAGGKWAAYKIGNGPDRANSHAEGESDGADECAKLIRAMKGAPVPELWGTVDKSGEYDADVFDSGRDSMADDVLDILNVYRDQFTEDERIEKVRALCREQLVSAPHKDQPEGEGK